jgi:hypothetical protein
MFFKAGITMSAFLFPPKIKNSNSYSDWTLYLLYPVYTRVLLDSLFIYYCYTKIEDLV